MLASELKKIPFLSAVPEADLESWAAAAVPREAERRQTIVQAGEPEPSLYLVRRGLVILCLESRTGETRMVGLADPSQCFNIQCLHPKLPASQSAHALTDVEVIGIPGEVVRASVRTSGTLAALLGGFAAGRLAEVSDDFVRATVLDVRARAAVALLKLADRLQTLNIPITQEQLSGIVGTRRETLALILGALRNEEVIDTRYRLIKILDRQRLLEASRDGYPTCVDHIVPVPLTGASCISG